MREGPGELDSIIEALREKAARYYTLTGKPLGITGEIAEYDAAHLLGLKLADARQAGYDATKPDGKRVQIKARAVKNASKLTGRVGAVRTTHDWECIMLVLMNMSYQTIAIYEADRSIIEHAKTRLDGKARQAGKIALRELVAISKRIWPNQ